MVPSVDAEIENEVWNAPRPESTTIVLDSTRTEQVFHTNFLWKKKINTVNELLGNEYDFFVLDHVCNGKFYDSIIKYSTMGTD